MADLWISKHALRRYLERVWGFVRPETDDSLALEAMQRDGVDLVRARAEIQAIVRDAASIGARSVKHRGVRFVFNGVALLSVVPVGRRQHSTCLESIGD